MKIRLEDGLPFVSASIVIGGRVVALPIALLDTGSAGSNTFFESRLRRCVSVNCRCET
jgi:hypothetical protein